MKFEIVYNESDAILINDDAKYILESIAKDVVKDANNVSGLLQDIGVTIAGKTRYNIQRVDILKGDVIIQIIISLE